MSIFPKGWGCYPPEYNREVHGPYNPSVYYGKRDTPFGDVKLKELFGWLARRRKTPRAMAQAISRAFFKYHINWVATKSSNLIFLYQAIASITIISYFVDYGRIKHEKFYRYH